MIYMITEFSGTSYDGSAVVFRSDDLISWLDCIQKLKKDLHLHKSNCAFWMNTRPDGLKIHFFSYAKPGIKLKERQKDLPFCRKPDFIWEGFPEGDEDNVY